MKDLDSFYQSPLVLMSLGFAIALVLVFLLTMSRGLNWMLLGFSFIFLLFSGFCTFTLGLAGSTEQYTDEYKITDSLENNLHASKIMGLEKKDEHTYDVQSMEVNGKVYQSCELKDKKNYTGQEGFWGTIFKGETVHSDWTVECSLENSNAKSIYLAK